MCRIGRQSHAPPERANTESEKTTRPPAVPHHGIMYDTNKNDCPFRVLPFAKLSRRDKIFTVSVHILSIDLSFTTRILTNASKRLFMEIKRIVVRIRMYATYTGTI